MARKITMESRAVERKTKVKRPGPIKVWSNVIRNYLIRDNSERGPVRDYNLYAGSNALYSGTTRVTYLYTIDKYPEKVPLSLRRKIRSQAKGTVRVSFISSLEPTIIPWDSPKMKSKLNTWRSADQESEGEEVTAYNYRQSSVGANLRSSRERSLFYLHNANDRKRSMIITRTLMVVSGIRGEEFDDSVMGIQAYCNSIGLGITRVSSDIESYLKAFSPFSNELDTKIRKSVGNSTMPDEIVARLSTYEQGRVGQGAYYVGTDIHSNFHVFKDFKKNETDAENFLISAETGGGKSFLIKALVLQFLQDLRFNGTIMDIEGDEYIPIANFVANDIPVVVINMAEGQGSYFDPMPVISTGDVDLDKDMFSLSVSCAKSIIRAVIGKQPEEYTATADTIIDSLVVSTYLRAGVRQEDPTSWRRSMGLSLTDVYTTAVIWSNALQSGNVGNDDLLRIIRDDRSYTHSFNAVLLALTQYFSAEGSKRSMFRNKVDLKDISSAKLVICSFGMRGRSPSSVDQSQMALSQIYAAHISHLRSIFSKLSGKFNFKVWEEFQRWGQFPGSYDTINTTLTGGRKLGDVNLIVTNKLSELLTDDRFGILQNTTSFAVGAIGDSGTREAFCRSQSIMQYYDDFSKITVPDTKNTSFNVGESLDEEEEVSNYQDVANSMYNKAFLLRSDRGSVAMVKVQMSEALGESDLFKTGVKVSGNISSIGGDIAGS